MQQQEPSANQESGLVDDPFERREVDEMVPDGLNDEANVDPGDPDLSETEAFDQATGRFDHVDVELTVDAVLAMLEPGQDDAPPEVFVWSNGDVSSTDAPPEPAATMVALFNPSDGPRSRDEVLAALENGFTEAAVVDDRVVDPRGDL